MTTSGAKRLLLIATTTTYRAHAFLEAARKLGVSVTVASERPQALAHLHPEGHLTLDFSDPLGAAGQVARFGERVRVDGVVSADDEGVLVAALAAERLALPHHSPAAAYRARNKLATRRTLASAGLPAPGFRAIPVDTDPEPAARETRMPCVLKPLHLSASRGVLRADSAPAFVAAFRRIGALLARADTPRLGAGEGFLDDAAEMPDPSRTILVEDYIPGVEVAVEGWLAGGRLSVFAVFDKPDPLEGPIFEETLYVQPTRLEPAARAAVIDAVERAARALGLGPGPVHAEVRWNDRGAWLLEIAPRSIGGLCSRALRFRGGAALEEVLLRETLGLGAESFELEPGASGVLMVPIPARGILRGYDVDAVSRVAGIEDLRVTIPIGQEVVPLPEGSSYLGFVFARGADAAAVEGSLRRAHAVLSIEIEPVSREHETATVTGEKAPW